MAKNDVVRVSAPNTTKTEKDRRDAIKAQQDAEIAAEAEYYKKMLDPNNQSAEAMAMRDGPIESLTPEVLGMIAMDVPVKWATNAAWRGLKKVLGFAGRGAKKGGQLTLDDLVKIYKEDPGRLPFKRSVSKADIEAFDALKKDISDWYIARKGVIDAAGRDTGIPDTLEGFLAGVRDAKLVDTSGVDTVLTSATLGDDLGKTLTLGVQKPVSSMPIPPGSAIDPIIYDTASEIALSDPLMLNLAKGAETVYHEVGGHAASRGAKATTISRAIQANNEAASRMRSLLDDPSSPVVDNFKARMARNDAFRSLCDALENDASSAEKIVEIVRDKYGVPARDLGYLDKPSEVMSRVWELRKRTGVSPETSWTPDFVAGVRRTGDLDDLALGNWTDEALAELANRMPAVAAPLAAAEAAERRQAAKGGESGRGKRESTAPTDEQLQEAATFLRLVIEKGFAKTDDEIEKCERLARAIEAAVGAEPVKPKEAPLEARPLRPNEKTQAAIDAGKADEEKDLFGRNGTVETTEQDVQDFKSNADPAAAQPVAPGQEQPAQQVAVRPRQEQPAQQVAVQPPQEQPAQQAAVQPQQEQLAPGLARSGSRSNILEFNGRRISQREFDRIQAKFLEGGGAQQPQAARPVQQLQVAANGADDALKPNNLRQSTQVDSGRKDALGRPLDEYGRVIA